MFVGIEIEVTTSCNFLCPFCPLAYDPKPKAIMPMDLFEHILDKAKAYKSITTVSINSYNEPTLDPHFMDRARTIASKNLWLLLHTNGSGLTRAKLNMLRDIGCVSELTFNLPSLDPAEFTRLTGGAKNLNHVSTMIDYAKLLGFKVGVSVNGTDSDLARNLPALKARYGSSVGFPGYDLATPTGMTNDRAGLLRGEYAQNINVTAPRLYGCNIATDWLYVNVHGSLFICCQDYKQVTAYASIFDGSISEILSSPAARKAYGYVTGAEEAPADHICRRCIYMACTEHLAKEEDKALDLPNLPVLP